MAKEFFQPLQGMADIAPPEVRLWQHVEDVARDLLARYAFREVRTPILESTAVFERALGTSTDVVQKEMYTFTDRGGRSLTLRPEGTAGVLRHVAGDAQNKADARLYYLGPMFRSERPQAGRRRQFHQLGVEAIGPPSPAADAEIMALQAHLLQAWGVRNFSMQVNTRGAAEDPPRVAAALREALNPQRAALCADCRRRFDENPLRILDCKNPACQDHARHAPPLTSCMSESARAYLRDVLRLLRRLDIPAQESPRLARGLDYYLHTVWEVTHGGLGAQNAISGGGRYALTFGGKMIEGVGFALGLERVIEALTREGAADAVSESPPDVWLVSQGTEAFTDNLLLMQSLRLRGVACAMDLRERSMKAQMRAAHRAGCAYAILRGDKEMGEGTFLLKNMAEGGQETLDLPELFARLGVTDPNGDSSHSC